ncbi:MAG: KpsF/GutQ family sugar-phosphate isomerase [Alphaproteobacteria bacterium]|nr:KpsF/GutQ family sugar-phosphate isomerase [Alphaproteobacteria bacterium]
MKMSENKDILVAQKAIDREIEALEIMKKELDENFSKVLDLIIKIKGRVIVTGMGKSGHIGRKIAATLASTGTPSFFVHPGEASHGDLGMLTNDDVVLAISNGGESRELSDILMYCKRYNIPLIAMTKNPESTLGKAGDYLLKLPNDGEACPLGLAPTSSTTATLVYGDAIAIALMERKGFTSTDYKQRHPGGKLGAILCKVSDLMHTGDEMPIIDEDAIMQDALLTMSAKMLGCVGVVNKKGELIGIITDGDLRRWMSPNLIEEKVSKVMTKNPKTIRPDVLASEAVYVMNNTGRGITNLFVVEDGKPVGLIHIHDCLRAGVN